MANYNENTNKKCDADRDRMVAAEAVNFQPDGYLNYGSLWKFTPAMIKEHIYNRAKAHIPSLTRDCVFAALVVDSKATKYNERTRKNEPLYHLSFQIALPEDDPSIIAKFAKNNKDNKNNTTDGTAETNENGIPALEFINSNITYYSDGYKNVARKFCNVKDGKIPEAISYRQRNGKKLKVLVLDTDMVFKSLVDASSKDFNHQYGGGGSRFDITIYKMKWRSEFVENGSPMFIKSGNLEKYLIDIILIKIPQDDDQGDGFDGLFKMRSFRNNNNAD